MKIFKLLLIALLFVSIPNKSFSQDTIHWRSDYELRWEDFQGQPDNYSQFGALSYCTIKYSLSIKNDTYEFKVFCFFNKSTSWTKEYSSMGLKHEQGHFNIAELFARKLRKSFKEYKLSTKTVKQDFKNFFEKNSKDRDKMDSQYDKETNFSRNKNKQSYWDKKILSELKKLDAYQ